MSAFFISITENVMMAALFALNGMSYVIRILLAGVAFGAAMNVESVLARVIGFVWLLLTGAGLLMVGITHGTIVDIFLGLAALGAAGYSWWFTRG